MTYLERYLKGEHEAVWDELIGLGNAVRKEPVYSDAKAVARETMQRTRRNIEKIYARLKSISYQFEVEKSHPKANPFADFEQQSKDDPTVKSLFGSLFNNLKAGFETAFPGLDLSKPFQPQVRYAYNPPSESILEILDEYEREVGNLPLSVRAWCEIVGDVDFIGDYPKLASYERKGMNPFDVRGMMRNIMIQNPDYIDFFGESEEVDLSQIKTPFPIEPFHKLIREEAQAAKEQAKETKQEETWWVSDPLCFDFDLDIDLAQEMMEEMAEELDELEDVEDGVRFGLMVAPDYHHKANFSGSSYDIMLPNYKADARLYGTDFHFVAYLRNSFAWGGFPGLQDYPEERDDSLIAMLKEGLEPI